MLKFWTFVCLFVCLLLGEQLLQSDTVDVHTEGDRTALTLNAAHKEHEGVYTVKLKTFDSLLEHSAFVYIQGEDEEEQEEEEEMLSVLLFISN